MPISDAIVAQWVIYGKRKQGLLTNIISCNVGVQYHSKLHVFPGAAKLWEIVNLAHKTNYQKDIVQGEFVMPID